MDIKNLINQRKGLYDQMCALNDLSLEKKRDLTADEQVTYNQLEADLDKFGKQIERSESLKARESELSNQRDSDYQAALSNSPETAPRSSKEYTNAFFGKGGLIRNKGVVSNLTGDIVNVLQTGIDGDGGFLVPEEFESNIMKLLYNADPIRSASTVMTLSNDRNIPVQTGGVTFGWLGENGSYGTVSPTVGKVVLSAHKLGGYIPVSDELLNDSGSNVESFIQDVGVQAVADLENAAYAAGDGAGKPEGLFSVTNVAGTAVGGITGAVSATAAITGDNLIDIFHSLGQGYRAKAKWLTSDSMVKLVRKLKDGDDQYLWQPGLTAGAPDSILGRSVMTSDYATDPAVSAKSIVFGDFSKYFIADRVGLSLMRLNELGALNGQVYFRMSKRTDGRLTDALAISTFTHGAAN